MFCGIVAFDDIFWCGCRFTVCHFIRKYIDCWWKCGSFHQCICCRASAHPLQYENSIPQTRLSISKFEIFLFRYHFKIAIDFRRITFACWMSLDHDREWKTKIYKFIIILNNNNVFCMKNEIRRKYAANETGSPCVWVCVQSWWLFDD